MVLNIDHYLQPSGKEGKPNEDYLLFDADYKIFSVLDGVTRDKSEGMYPNPSPSADVAIVIAHESFQLLKNQAEPLDEESIKKALIGANTKVKTLNQETKLNFLPGAVGILAAIQNNVFYYGFIGDCSGRLISGGKTVLFTRKQTKQIQKHKKEFSTFEIRNVICNNIFHKYGYGVLNGEVGANSFIETGQFKIYKNDIIVLYTDGLDAVMDDKTIDDLVEIKAEDLIKEAIIKDSILAPENSDDKAIIIIKVI